MDAFKPRKFYSVLDLLTWKSLPDSLGVFASLNFFFLLLTVYDFSLVSLVAYLLLGYLATLYLLQVLGNPIHTDDDYEFVSREIIEKTLATVHAKSNALLRGVSEMSMDETFVQVLLGLFLCVYLTQMFSCAGFLWLVAFSAFTLPLAYSTNSDLVDSQLKTVRGLYTNYKELAMRSIPRASSVQKAD